MRRIIYLATIFGISILFFVLPYYFFEGKFFIGGDDTRLLYSYPKEYLTNWALYSWNSVSSLNFFNTSFHLIPFLLLLSGMEIIVGNKLVLSYLGFSAPLVLGFNFIIRLFEELTGDKKRMEYIVAGLVYVLSPIFFLHQYQIFLTPVWLVAIFPVVSYFVILYMHKGKLVHLIILSSLSLVFSFAFYAFAWIFGLLIPLIAGVIILKLVGINILNLVQWKRLIIALLAVGIPQLFWFIPFSLSLLSSADGNFGTRVFSGTATSTFSPTIIATATGNIFYPLLNLFHAQIINDFEWISREIFNSFYVKIIPLLAIFPLMIIFALHIKKQKFRKESKRLMLSFVFLMVSLYFFTINLGFLRYFFLALGSIPGFVMFRNYYDKFEVGYVFLYAITFGLSFVLLSRRFPKLSKPLLILTIGVMILAALPFKQLINSEIWKTEGYYKTVTLPTEYLDFAKSVKNIVPAEGQILSLPFNNAGYVVIMDANRRNAYVGTSPLKILTGRSDLTGDLSFSKDKAGQFNNLILSKDYEGIKNFLFQHNVNFIISINNIPSDLGINYFIERAKNNIQDEDFIRSIAGEELIKSKNGNYTLYAADNSSTLFSDNVTYKRLSPVAYELKINDKKSTKEIVFKDTFHPGWILTESSGNSIYLKSIGKHLPAEVYGNKWIIEGNELEDNTLYLYFLPQNSIFLGVVVAAFVYAIFIFVVIKYKGKVSI